MGMLYDQCPLEGINMAETRETTELDCLFILSSTPTDCVLAWCVASALTLHTKHVQTCFSILEVLC
jgi:hypothetical protein